MDGYTRSLFVAIVAGFIILGGGAAVLLGAGGSGGTTQPSDAESIVGVIVGVDSVGLDKVSGFRLRTTAGDALAFDLHRLANGAQFAPGNLVEHQATGQPVRVWYRTEGGVRFAIRLEDAP
jgi:hypothetical protein